MLWSPGTEQGKEIVDALVSQSRENLRLKMSDYRTRKAEWEKRLALIQVILMARHNWVSVRHADRLRALQQAGGNLTTADAPVP